MGQLEFEDASDDNQQWWVMFSDSAKGFEMMMTKMSSNGENDVKLFW